MEDFKKASAIPKRKEWKKQPRQPKEKNGKEQSSSIRVELL